MKIALCISGLIREAKLCHKNLKKFVLDANPDHTFDIFCTTWDSKIDSIKVQPKNDCSWQEVLDLYKPIANCKEVYDEAKKAAIFEDAKLDYFLDRAKKRKISIRTDGRWKDHGKCDICGHCGRRAEKCRICGGPLIHNMAAMFYQIDRCTTIMADYQNENSCYDLIIRSRYDNYFMAPLKFPAIPPIDNILYIPAGFDDFEEFGGGPNDQMAWGSVNTIFAYADIYHYLGIIFDEMLEKEFRLHHTMLLNGNLRKMQK